MKDICKVTSFLQKMKKDFGSIEITPSKLSKGIHTSSIENMNSHRSTTSNKVEKDTNRESLSISKFPANKTIIMTLKSRNASLSPKSAKILQNDLSNREITPTAQYSPNSRIKINDIINNKLKSQISEPVFDEISPDINKYSTINNLDHSFGIYNSCLKSIDNFNQKTFFICRTSEAQPINRDFDFNNYSSEFLISNAPNNQIISHNTDERGEYQDQIITSIRKTYDNSID